MIISCASITSNFGERFEYRHISEVTDCNAFVSVPVVDFDEIKISLVRLESGVPLRFDLNNA